MKRVLISMLALAAVAVSTLFVGCQQEQPTRALESDLVVYFNGKQVLEKSGLLEQIEPLRNLMAAGVAQEFDGDDQKFVEGVVKNLDNSGITFSKPFYMNMNFSDNGEPENVAIIAKVNNAGNVDHLFEMLGLEINERKGNNRMINAGEAVIGYNNSRIALVVDMNAMGESYDFLQRVLSSADEDLSIFGKRDMGLYVNAHAIMEVVKNSNLEQSDILQSMGLYYEAEEVLAQNEQISEYMAELDPEAYLLAGLTFEPGRIVVDMDAEGFPDNNLSKKVSNDNLAYIPGTAWAVANMGVNGAAVAEQIATLVTPEVLGVEEGAEFGMIMSVVEDVLNSFAGDVTLALNSYREGYYGPVVDAIAMIDVKDNYIISNLSTYAPYAGVQLEREGKNQYALNIDYSNDLHIGQTDNTFYVGVNSLPEKLSNSAAKARWFGDVNNTYGYLVVDANNLIKKFRYDLQAELGYEAMEVVDMLDYAYLSFPTTKTFEFALALKDRNTNAFAQIADLLISAFGDELSGDFLDGLLDEMAIDEEYDDYEPYDAGDYIEDDYGYSDYEFEDVTEEDLEQFMESLEEMEDLEDFDW